MQQGLGKRRIVRRRMRGKGWLGDAWNAVKSTVSDVAGQAAKAAATAAKEALALTAAETVGRVSPTLGRLTQKGIYKLGDKYGFGRRRRKVGRGGSYEAVLKKMLETPPVVSGYGRRRRRVAPKKKAVLGLGVRVKKVGGRRKVGRGADMSGSGYDMSGAGMRQFYF